MAPNSSAQAEIVQENDEIEITTKNTSPGPSKRKYELVWLNIILYAYLHVASLYGIYLMFTSAKIATPFFGFLVYTFGGFGLTAGAHRLWSHRSYKATWQLRLILMLLNTMAFENAVVFWARDHRVHHKFTDTDADPHNAKRGFFYSHIGWLFVRKHPLVVEKGKEVDMSDLWADPILRFQKKYYLILMPTLCFVMPTIVPMYLWGETFQNAYYLNLLRYCCSVNATFLINSAAHAFGNRPYDKNILPTENLIVSLLVLGDGWHNYHHVFPWDYKTSEWGQYNINITNAFLDFFAKIGWAYDLKSASETMIRKRAQRTGDGTHEVWGWGDKDQPQEDYEDVVITYKKELN